MDRQAEIEFIKDLFEHHLPLGEDKKQIEEYFSRLQQAIVNKEEIKNEQFPDDDDTNEYKYHSASLFKERASRFRHQSDAQDVGIAANGNRPIDLLQDHSQVPADLQHIPERPLSPDIDPLDIDGHESH